MTFANGCVFVGEWKNDHRVYGEENYGNGSSYEGQYLNDIRHGYGKLTYADNRIYEGEFIDNFKHGKGKMTFANGCVFVGEWKNDHRVYGEENYGNGSSYE